MPLQTLDIYFDYISPFAYLLSEKAGELAEREDIAVDWKPIQLEKLSNYAEGPPYSVAKRKYVAVDAARSAQFYEVPLQPPHPFPVRSETALLLALVAKEAGIFEEVHREIFRAAWAQQQDISDLEVLEQCIRAAGHDPRPLLDRTKASTVRAQLIAHQLDAESKGVFGVPTIALYGELFWGVDQLPKLGWRLDRLARERARTEAKRLRE